MEVVLVVTLCNYAPNPLGNGHTTCSIFPRVEVRPVGALEVPVLAPSKSLGGPTHVQLAFPQELPRSPLLCWPLILGRSRLCPRFRPQDREESSGCLSLDFEVQRHWRSGSSEGLRQAGRFRERFRGTWRQSHSGGKRAEICHAMEIFPRQLRDRVGAFRNL